jgi:hypothetical protein
MSGAVLFTTVQDIKANLDILKSRIQDGFVLQGKKDPAKVQQEMDLYTVKSQKGVYDAKFLEEQFPYQKSPKKRRQTLQEFVLLFFYISLAIFCLSVTLYAFLENGQSYSAAAKAFGLCIVLCIAITAILIKVA